MNILYKLLFRAKSNKHNKTVWLFFFADIIELSVINGKYFLIRLVQY